LFFFGGTLCVTELENVDLAAPPEPSPKRWETSGRDRLGGARIVFSGLYDALTKLIFDVPDADRRLEFSR
jgi:hypothetical protein